MIPKYRILFAQPIFGPDEIITEKNIRSILSLGAYLKENKISHVDVVFGGWTIKPEYMDRIKLAIRKYFPYAEIQEYENNVGKATVVNNMSKKLNDAHLFFMTADSDIVFPKETEQLFERLATMAQVSEQVKKQPFGMIGLNQLEANCHLPHCQENVVQYDATIDGKVYREKMVWPTSSGGIAGGCLFISKVAWKAIGGYKIMGVYSGDDAYFMLDCAMRGLSYQMSDSIGIIHPADVDAEYAQWKVRVCQRDSGAIRTDITEQINEAENFWKSR